MHSANYNKIVIFYNSDYSGEVIIRNKITEEEVRLDMDDLRDFVAESVRMERIEKIEQMDADELLGRNV